MTFLTKTELEIATITEDVIQSMNGIDRHWIEAIPLRCSFNVIGEMWKNLTGKSTITNSHLLLEKSNFLNNVRSFRRK